MKESFSKKIINGLIISSLSFGLFSANNFLHINNNPSISVHADVTQHIDRLLYKYAGSSKSHKAKYLKKIVKISKENAGNVSEAVYGTGVRLPKSTVNKLYKSLKTYKQKEKYDKGYFIDHDEDNTDYNPLNYKDNIIPLKKSTTKRYLRKQSENKHIRKHKRIEARKKYNHKYNKLGTYAQGKNQAKKDVGLSRGRLFKSLIGHKRRILSNRYENGYTSYMSSNGKSYFDGDIPSIKSARIYLLDNKMTKKAIWDYIEHNGKSNKKLMKRNRQYKRTFKKVKNAYNYPND